MNPILENMIWFLVGFLVGFLLMAYGARQDRKKIEAEKEDVMKMAKEELDAMERRAGEAERELMVKQNIIDSLSGKVQRQQRIIDRKRAKDGN